MLKCDTSKINKLTNDNITEIKFENIVCYVFVGGNPGGTEGDVYIFDIVNGELRVHRGNIFHGGLSRGKVCALIPKADMFFERWSMRACEEGWKCVPYVMGYYVFIKFMMSAAIVHMWEKITDCSYFEKLVKSVFMTCKMFEKHLHPEDEIVEEEEVDESVLQNMKYRVLELAAANRDGLYPLKRSVQMMMKIIEKELGRE